MVRSILLAAGSIGLALAAGGAATAQTLTQAPNFAAFKTQFCAAGGSGQHVFVMPIAIFMDEKMVECDDGTSMLRTTEPANDPGHIVFNIDPPAGSMAALDCDGKADEGMTIVAINCLPVGDEAATHKKSE